MSYDEAIAPAPGTTQQRSRWAGSRVSRGCWSGLQPALVDDMVVEACAPSCHLLRRAAPGGFEEWGREGRGFSRERPQLPAGRRPRQGPRAPLVPPLASHASHTSRLQDARFRSVTRSEVRVRGSPGRLLNQAAGLLSIAGGAWEPRPAPAPHSRAVCELPTQRTAGNPPAGPCRRTGHREAPDRSCERPSPRPCGSRSSWRHSDSPFWHSGLRRVRLLDRCVLFGLLVQLTRAPLNCVS